MYILDNMPAYPLTQPQYRIWITQMIYRDSPMYNIGGIEWMEEVDQDRLRQAIQLFLNRHMAFHIRLTVRDNHPCQYFVDAGENCDVETVEFTSVNNAGLDAIVEWASYEMSVLFPMNGHSLYRFYLLMLDGKAHGYFIKLHHLIADGWSMQLLSQGIQEIYESFREGKNTEQDTLYQYTDYIRSEELYLHSEQYKRDRVFFNDLFRERQLKEPPYATSNDSERAVRRLSVKQTEGIRSYCGANDISVASFFAGLYIVCRCRYDHVSEMVLGIPVLGRSKRSERTIFGMFAGALPLPASLDKAQPLQAFLKEIHRMMGGIYKHHRYPFNHLVQDMNCDSRTLYNHCMNYYHTTIDPYFDGSPKQTLEVFNRQQAYATQLVIREWMCNGSIQLEIDYQTELYTAWEVEKWFDTLMDLVSHACQNPCLPVGDLFSWGFKPQGVSELFNHTDMDLPYETILAPFARLVEKYPDSPAVSYRNRTDTYAEFAEKAETIKSWIRSHEIKSGLVIGVMMHRSMESMAAMWGILMAGCVILPINPDCPLQRLVHMLSDSNAACLFVDKVIGIPGYSGRVQVLSDCACPKEDHAVAESLPDTLPQEDAAAYIIYTSGSTGKPKGVIISHGSLLNYTLWAQKAYAIEPSDVMAFFTSPAFDLTLTSIIVPLASGAAVRVFDDQEGNLLSHILNENKCTIMKLTPSHLGLMPASFPKDSVMRRFIIGGEALTSAAARSLHIAAGSKVKIYNEYGPTEATIGCMLYEYNPHGPKVKTVPIGSPADNCRIYILGPDGQQVPVGMEGEICIAGKCLAHGYLNLSVLTAASFVTHPCIEGERVYKTGDIGRFIDPSTIEYVGRMDMQIKLRGYRIDPNEIENCLYEIPEIRQAAVLVKNNQLYAFCAAELPVENNRIIGHLSDQLPSYMIPVEYIYMAALPLTPHGKLDYARLMAMDFPERAPMEIRTERDQDVAKIMAEVLGVEKIGLNDNFFRLGGDSIKAILISSKLSDINCALAVRDILKYPDFMDMFQRVTIPSADGEADKIQSGRFGLTPLAGYLLRQQKCNIDNYTQGMVLCLQEFCSHVELEALVNKLVQHHDMLRANYNPQQGALYYNDDYVQGFQLDSYRAGKNSDPLQEAMTILHDYSVQMDITGRPLFRAFTLQGAKEAYVCILIHHLAVDGISWRILLEDIDKMLDQTKQRKPLSLSPKTQSFAKWVHSAYPEEAGVPVIKVLPDRNTSAYAESIVFLSKDETRLLLKEANLPFHTQPVELMLAALQMAIAELYTKPEDIQLLIEHNGRDVSIASLDITHTVGWFTSFFIMDWASGKIYDHWIRNIKETYRKSKIVAVGSANMLKKVFDSGRSIQFNYLGEIKKQYRHFHMADDVVAEYLPFAQIDINVYVEDDMLTASIKTDINSVLGSQLADIRIIWMKHLQALLAYCSEKQDLEFSPSDFKDTNMTQEDLDILFQ